MAEDRFTPYALTSLPNPQNRDPNGIYFIRTATGMRIYAIANTPGREPVELDPESFLQDLQSVTDQGNITTNSMTSGDLEMISTTQRPDHFEVMKPTKSTTKYNDKKIEMYFPNRGTLNLLAHYNMAPNQVTYNRNIVLSVNGTYAGTTGNINLDLSTPPIYNLVEVTINTGICINLGKNETRYLIRPNFSPRKFCLSANQSDVGKEFLIINDTGLAVGISDESNFFYGVTVSPLEEGGGMREFPARYKGRFRVLQDLTFLEILN